MRAIFPEEVERGRVDGLCPTKRGDRYGFFWIPMSASRVAFVAVSNGQDGDGGEVVPWEHVSARIVKQERTAGGKRKSIDETPTWEQMCRIKDLFFEPDEWVVQYHPPEAEYVNVHPNVLHLWRWTGGEFPTPPRICV
jgi:hypothetical protein